MDNQTMLDRIFAGYDGFFASEKKIAGYIMENHKKTGLCQFSSSIHSFLEFLDTE